MYKEEKLMNAFEKNAAPMCMGMRWIRLKTVDGWTCMYYLKRWQEMEARQNLEAEVLHVAAQNCPAQQVQGCHHDDQAPSIPHMLQVMLACMSTEIVKLVVLL